ncbi:MAG: GNAT family N-acetyltransferase [Candidatus Buchananbacteria bacterium]
MEIREIKYGSKEYEESVELRNKILRIPLGHFLDINNLQKEESDIHIVAIDNGKIVGILILTPIEDSILKMRQVAVANELQGRGVGSSLVEFAEKIAREQKVSKIILDARSSALDFYLRKGYKVVGDEYIDEHINIPHYKMEKFLK